jgi:HSP20 family protein
MLELGDGPPRGGTFGLPPSMSFLPRSSYPSSTAIGIPLTLTFPVVYFLFLRPSQIQPSRGGGLFDTMIQPFFSDPFFNSFGSELGLGFPAFPGRELGQLMQRMPQLPSLKLDVRENERSYEITADVPGVNKENVNVEVDADNNLHIKTEGKKEHREEGEREGWKYLRQERSESSASRVLKLPNNCDASSIEAKVDNGILKVVVPKLRPQAETRRRINVA